MMSFHTYRKKIHFNNVDGSLKIVSNLFFIFFENKNKKHLKQKDLIYMSPVSSLFFPMKLNYNYMGPCMFIFRIISYNYEKLLALKHHYENFNFYS